MISPFASLCYVPLSGPVVAAIDLFSALAWCLRVVFLTGMEGVIAWTGTALSAVTAWFLMQAWIRGWNRVWDSTAATALRLVFTLATAGAVLVCIGAWNLTTIVTGAVRGTADDLRNHERKLVYDIRDEALSFVHLNTQENRDRPNVDVPAGQPRPDYAGIADKRVEAAFYNQQLRQFTPAASTFYPATGNTPSADPFTIKIDEAADYFDQSVGRIAEAATGEVKRYAEVATWFVIGWVTKIYLATAALLALLAAWRAYAAIFRSPSSLELRTRLT